MKKFGLPILIVLFSLGLAWAADEAPTAASNKTAIELVQTHADYVWTLVAAALVFFMQAGFAMVETGFTRAKNAINIMMKNLMDFAIGSIAFWAIGFGLMFGVTSTGWFGTSGFFLSDFTPGGDPWVLAFWMFQVVFAATAATIVSGAMAERTKFSGYLIYSVAYQRGDLPGFRQLGLGESLPRQRLAGRTGVHRFRRLDRGPFRRRLGGSGRRDRAGAPDGQIHQRRQDQTDSGPQYAAGGPGRIYPVAGLVRVQSRFHHGRQQGHRHDLCQYQPGRGRRLRRGHVCLLDQIRQTRNRHELKRRPGRPGGHYQPLRDGFTPERRDDRRDCGRNLVVFSVLFFDRIKIDDPVGAISVHGVCGAWGTLAAGLFNLGGTSLKIVGIQVLGIAACFLWVFPMAFIMFKLIDMTVGLRVSAEEELEGLDFVEHGGNAYPDFEVSSYGGMSVGPGKPSAPVSVAYAAKRAEAT